MLKKLFLALIVINGLQNLYCAGPAKSAAQRVGRCFRKFFISPHTDFPTNPVNPLLEEDIKRLARKTGTYVFSVRFTRDERFSHAGAISCAPKEGEIIIGCKFFPPNTPGSLKSNNHQTATQLTALQRAIVLHEIGHISDNDSALVDFFNQIKAVVPLGLGWLTQITTKETLTAVGAALFVKWGINKTTHYFMRKNEFRADKEAFQHFTEEEYDAYIKLLEEAKSDHPNWARWLTLLINQPHPTPAQRIKALQKLKKEKLTKKS